ncbi:prolyl-tRNA synthetase [Mollisia scopiformis]|uniref:proline--tRNA ligase n=1 Tax=Mollisia scopiformis TaxID=149040 RepID=A0A194XKD0_MOLSC|nr:prolyl-tRNA synthetase [Mollisia scopiformis]KUJ20247.1 prolyl-tRNA synthetase [Mollisia scopiformis]
MKCFFATPLFFKGSQINSVQARNRCIVQPITLSRLNQCIRFNSTLSTQENKEDDRIRLSKLWVPTGGIAVALNEDSHSKLIRAGFLRQAHSGIFHMLPLGRKVQDKLEALIDKYMSQLGASKLALSSISSEELWARSGRLNSVGAELFRFQDRRDARYILSPTHEEEITSLVASTVSSYKDLPARLYQISRKYRDELRPRHGLLRTREFVMKDLYTFDYTSSLALATYHQVRAAYARLFDEIKLPYLVAEADSGDMGGNLSHEFHFPTSKGEDHVISCTSCDYVANEELAESANPQSISARNGIPEADGVSGLLQDDVHVWRGTSRDRSTLINVWYAPELSQCSPSFGSSSAPEVNMIAVKALVPDLDTSLQDCLSLWTLQTFRPTTSCENSTPVPPPRRVLNLVDCRLSSAIRESIVSGSADLQIRPAFWEGFIPDSEIETVVNDPLTQQPLNLLRIRAGDLCPRCPDGKLKVERAIELGHTFHLGTRYSDPLSASVTVPSDLLDAQQSTIEESRDGNHNVQTPLQMGCHGIGVTRMIGAVAETLADDKGLNWPRAMAPYEVVIVPGKDLEKAANEVYDALCHPIFDAGSVLDLIIDDRSHSFPWKMRDADLVGYPVIVVVGRRWNAEHMVEIQCRRLGVRQDLHITEALLFVKELLLKL